MASPENDPVTSPIESDPDPVPETGGGPDLRSGFGRCIKPLASLKLTVVLFLLGIFIVLAGTFAQVDKDIWEVIQIYFRFDLTQLVTASFPFINFGELFVWVDAKLFFPPSFFPKEPVIPGWAGWMKPFWPHGTPDFPNWAGIWFPKGWVIGIAMMLNLLAAHAVRFKVQAKGSRLFAGCGILALGCLLTALIIISGSVSDGLQAKPLISYTALKWLLQSTLFGLTGVCIYGAFAADRDHAEQRWLFGLIASVLALGSVFVFKWDAEDEAAMRILYQLVKSTFAAVILLAGCIVVFKKRAGIVLLHAGVMLIMAYDVLVGVRHVESQMTIEEGQTVAYSRDIRSVEFAVIDRSDPDEDHVTVIADSMLQQPGTTISDEKLPFDIEILDYLKNSDLRRYDPDEEEQENPATTGIGRRFIAKNVRPAAGTDTGGAVDVPSAYVRLKSRDGEDLGTYLVSAFPDMAPGMLPETQTVEVDGKTYDIALRYERLYKGYQITLNDVQKNDYMGTDRPKDYSSYIVVSDPNRGVEFEHRIWMNNPMRYAGETFYQSSYIPAGALGSGSRETTVLQVVDNEGWMTPYVGCMIVAVGMLFQFGLTLLRFLGRRVHYEIPAAQPIHLIDEPEPAKQASAASSEAKGFLDVAGWIVAGLIVALALGWVASKGRAPSQKAGEFHIATFGELPMWYKGRAMPIDTFARNSLLQLSDRETFELEGKRQPALRWLIELLANEEKAREFRTIRIENLEVLETIGVERREGFTYSVDELTRHADKIIEQAQAASRVPAEERTLYQRKVLEVANRIIFYNFLERTLGRAPQLPNETEVDPADVQALAARADEYFRFIRFARRSLKEFADQYSLGPLPLIVPTHLDAGDRPPMEEFNTTWEPVTIADIYAQFYDEFPRPTPPAIAHFVSMLDAYRDGNTRQFNSELQKYRELLEKHTGTAVDEIPLARTDFEAVYNRFDAFNRSSWLYVFAGILAALGWLIWPQVFHRASFWLIAGIFLIHTAALIARIYISGRPPVTNLYSSAIFIGWAVVLGGMIIELVSRIGIGNVVAAIAGFLTLRVAHGLASDGDTFVVLEAVLDTQFWLATHVVCITLGYATTYIAGLLGILYILLGVCTPALKQHVSKEITRMTYGSLCFALFFSFVGTVLGGLWADDSWGRFWGWDPKENGALIIVLWNALILHARWGAMIRERGMAVLAVLGNTVVSWSWFGVNELGVGLHSYGFTEGRLLMLCLFVMSQLVIAGVGCLPREIWASSRHLTKSG
jgi:ABC-type transport system involved in cytochrome c biogenesis permease subunit